MRRKLVTATSIASLVGTVLLTSTALLANPVTALTFGEWAISKGYVPPGPTNWACDASKQGIASADGVDNYTNVRSLNLWLNQISSLSPDQFHGLANLEVLQLGANNIPSLSVDQFQGLTRLRQLELHSNQIPSLSANQFLGLTNLRKLSLYDNQISALSANQFQGLTSLESLSLWRNTDSLAIGQSIPRSD